MPIFALAALIGFGFAASLNRAHVEPAWTVGMSLTRH